MFFLGLVKVGFPCFEDHVGYEFHLFEFGVSLSVGNERVVDLEFIKIINERWRLEFD